MKVTTTLSIAAILVLGACSTDPKPSAEVRVTNSDVEKALKARIANEPRLASLRIDVDADVDKNELTLKGTVPSEAQRTQIVEMAKASRPGARVIDKIDVKPPEVARSEYTDEMARETREKARVRGDKVGSSVEDAWIHTKLVAKLIGDSQTPARKINVDVDHNVVTLRGTVESAVARDEAERVARGTDGVKRVINLLKVVAG
jgi:osmotically-inducible protein OsmY